MRLLYFWRHILGSSGLWLGAAGLAHAQEAPGAAAHLPTCLLKGGLRLTHLSYSRSATAWQALVPASLAAEYRLGSRYSAYAQLDADLQFGSAARARRGRRAASALSTTLPAVALGLGGRYYYSRPAASAARVATGAPEFGRYLALESGAELIQATAATSRATALGPVVASRGRTPLAAPFLFARWGVQNRARPHLLYDLNAGLGLVAAARPATEYTTSHRRLDVAAQVNISFYLAK